MPSIWKRFAHTKAEPYVFPDAAELKVEEAPFQRQPGLDEEVLAAETPETPAPPPTPEEDPVSFAQIQAEALLADARRQADQLLEEARKAADKAAEAAQEAARIQGHQEGYQQGLAQALEEGRRKQEEQAAALSAAVEQWMDKAGACLDRRLDQSVDDLRDLAVAIAEKVVRISLKSSGEVIGRMIQSAIDKRKRREWVHIYIAECDAKRMGQIPASLSNALASLSDRVRIIPMADDESGTCIIEMPDEIIDASAATQLSNIKNLLMDAPSVGAEIPEMFR